MNKWLICLLCMVSASLAYSQHYDGVSPGACSVNGFRLTDSLAVFLNQAEGEYQYGTFALSDNEVELAIQHTYKFDSAVFIFVENRSGIYPDIIQIRGSRFTLCTGDLEFSVGDSAASLIAQFPASWESRQRSASMPDGNFEVFVRLVVTHFSSLFSKGSIRFLVGQGRINEILIRYQP